MSFTVTIEMVGFAACTTSSYDWISSCGIKVDAGQLRGWEMNALTSYYSDAENWLLYLPCVLSGVSFSHS